MVKVRVLMLGVLVTGLALICLPRQEVSAQPQMERARILVTLPSDANLFFDDHQTSSTGGERFLETPALEGGYDYSYVVRGVIWRNGQTYNDEQTVIVRAGKVTGVTLFPAFLGAATVQQDQQSLYPPGGNINPGFPPGGGSGGNNFPPQTGGNNFPPPPGGGTIVQKMVPGPNGTMIQETYQRNPNGTMTLISCQTAGVTNNANTLPKINNNTLLKKKKQ